MLLLINKKPRDPDGPERKENTAISYDITVLIISWDSLVGKDEHPYGQKVKRVSQKGQHVRVRDKRNTNHMDRS